MTQATIRRAGAGDAATLAVVGKATFAEAFGRLYPPADLEAFLASTHDTEKVRSEITSGGCAAWLAETADGPVGYAVAGPCSLPHPEVTTRSGELKRLYVLSPWRGGLGSHLFDRTLAWLDEEGRRPIWIGVWSRNDKAQRLYERRGFAKVGEYEFHVGATRDHEFIYRRG